MIICTNCNTTTLLSIVQTKLIGNLVLNIEGKIVSYTAFNDAIQSFFLPMLVVFYTPISSIAENELTLSYYTQDRRDSFLTKPPKLK